MNLNELASAIEELEIRIRRLERLIADLGGYQK